MLFGIAIKPFMLVAGGTTLFVLLVLQVLLGMRKIKFKGALHTKIHRWLAYGILAAAVFHGAAALAYLEII